MRFREMVNEAGEEEEEVGGGGAGEAAEGKPGVAGGKVKGQGGPQLGAGAQRALWEGGLHFSARLWNNTQL